MESACKICGGPHLTGECTEGSAVFDEGKALELVDRLRSEGKLDGKDGQMVVIDQSYNLIDIVPVEQVNKIFDDETRKGEGKALGALPVKSE